MDEFLAGVGFYKLSEKNRKILWTVLLVSLAVHLVAGLIFGSIVIMRALSEEKIVFSVPPTPRKSYEPRKLEHKVKVQKRQRSSSRPTMVPRMVAMRQSNVSLPDIKVDQRVINTSFQPKFKSVSGKGVGVGLGTGYGIGGFGPGVSTFDFFGIRGRGDKVALLVDVSTSMVEEQMGGVEGYMKVKSRVGKVIDALSEGAIFNVIVFGDASDAFFKKLEIASVKHKKDAKDYLRPFNTEGNWGLAQGNVKAEGRGLQADGGSTRLDLALTAAFQQGANTILVISDGAPMVLRQPTQDEYQAYNNKKSEWEKENKKQIQDDKNDAAGGKMEKVWIPDQPARPPKKGPPKEGEAPDNGSPAIPGHWEERWTTPPKKGPDCPIPAPKAQYWNLTEFLQHLKLLHENYYLAKGMKPPIIHCIGYKIDKEGNAFLKGVAKEYKGQYKKVNTLGK